MHSKGALPKLNISYDKTKLCSLTGHVSVVKLNTAAYKYTTGGTFWRQSVKLLLHLSNSVKIFKNIDKLVTDSKGERHLKTHFLNEVEHKM